MIDVHHHFVPDAYRSALLAAGIDRPDGMPAIPPWSEASALAFIDQMGIDTAYLSISTPGVFFEGSAAADLARIVNETAAGLIATHPGRFGSFATLPLPDVAASLEEIAHSLDHLALDGIVMLTHYGDIYLGDPRLDPVFDELNRRRAIVFIHPTSPICCEQTALGFPRPILEFMFDTTRTVTNLIYSGTLDRCPDISWIIPHAGAALPSLVGRIDMMRAVAPDRCHAAEPVANYLGRFHYDVAGPRTDDSLRGLLGIANSKHVLYGSDWPFTPAPGVTHSLEALNATTVFDADQLNDIYRYNARRLLPRSR
jgi:6-methylsalicylate decarboxylase